MADDIVDVKKRLSTLEKIVNTLHTAIKVQTKQISALNAKNRNLELKSIDQNY